MCSCNMHSMTVTCGGWHGTQTHMLHAHSMCVTLTLHQACMPDPVTHATAAVL